jgi:hypothetical protein
MAWLSCRTDVRSVECITLNRYSTCNRKTIAFFSRQYLRNIQNADTGAFGPVDVKKNFVEAVFLCNINEFSKVTELVT